MKINKFAVFLCSMLFLLGISSVCSAIPIVVQNNDFEAVMLADGSFVSGSIPDWGLDGATAGTYDPPDSSDNNVAYINSNYIGQWLNVPIQAGYTYEFDVLAASRNGTDTFGVSFIVRDGFNTGNYIAASEIGTTGTSAAGDLVPLTFSTTFDSAYWGNELGIWLKLESGDQVWFDDVKVNAYEQAPVPEPATMLLLGTGLVGLAAFGRKKFFKKK